MAVVENIPEKNQSPSAQKGVIEYCCQAEKTQLDRQTVFVTGINCIPEYASESFLATQKVFGCEPDSVRFYHYVQSFMSQDSITPQIAHEIGVEFAKYFGNREVIIATHLDGGQLHNHYVVNSYDLNTGLKLHMNKFTLKEMRDLSDRLCCEHGLSVLLPYDPTAKSNNLRQREYRAAMKGESWKFEICAAIDECMKHSRSRKELREQLNKLGYDFIWNNKRKYITYIRLASDNKPEHRVRDIKLHEQKYLKENMENEFRIREELFGFAEGKERASYFTGTTVRENGSDIGGGMASTVSSADADGGASTARTGGENSDDKLSGGIPCSDESCGGNADKGSTDGNIGDSRDKLRTGWESERTFLTNDIQTDVARGSAVVAPSSSYGSADDIASGALGLLRFGADFTSVTSNDEESEEEKKEREARNTGSVIGVVAGLAIGAALTNRDVSSDNNSDDEEEQTENENSQILSM